MALSVGMHIPSCSLYMASGETRQAVETTQYFAQEKIVVFVVPGAFTPTCSHQHLPGFVQNFDALMATDIDSIICLSVNDIFVMQAWAQSTQASDKITMLADVRGAFCSELGILVDMGDMLGKRANRCAFISEKGIITHSFIEEPKSFAVSSAQNILSVLRD